METYLIPIQSAIFVFIVLVNFVAIPLLFWEYHKKGALTILKGMVIYSFIFYLITAFFMTLLPLPSKESVLELTGPYAQLIPFNFINDIMRESVFNIRNLSSYFPALTQGVVLQVVFNLFLTIPFGIYLRYYFKKSLKQIIFLSFLMSLFYEITQLTGIYGIYPRPYRLFDVDDLMLNTLGGILGYYIAPGVVFLFPTRDQIDKNVELSAIRIPFLRRVFAYNFDYYIYSFIIGLFFISLPVSKYAINFLVSVCLGITYYLFDGHSLGLKIMKLKIVSKNKKKLTLMQSMLRSILFSLIYNITFVLSLDFFNYLTSVEFNNRNALIIYLFIMFSIQIVMVVHTFYCAILHRDLLIYEKISKTRVISEL